MQWFIQASYPRGFSLLKFGCAILCNVAHCLFLVSKTCTHMISTRNRREIERFRATWSAASTSRAKSALAILVLMFSMISGLPRPLTKTTNIKPGNFFSYSRLSRASSAASTGSAVFWRLACSAAACAEVIFFSPSRG